MSSALVSRNTMIVIPTILVTLSQHLEKEEDVTDPSCFMRVSFSRVLQSAKYDEMQ